jgi:predicted ABC-type ATPase
MPNLYIIAGCNGAGKTTASFTVLPEILDCKEFVNADEIAKGLSPFQPEKAAFDAGRIMLSRIHELMADQVDFAFETTLSTRSYVSLVKKAQAAGYRVSLLFFWLDSISTAKERVKHRVQQGGHNIPEDVIERRYSRGIQNLKRLYIPIVDYWIIFDNTREPVPVAESLNTVDFNIINPDIWVTITNEE